MIKKISAKQITIYSSIISIIAITLLILIIYFNPYKIPALLPADTHSLLNGSFNFASALFLIFAFISIKQKKIKAHKILIHIALSFSALFLVSYILYHMSIGHTVFPDNAYRTLYLCILLTHLLASVISLPIIFITYALGITAHLVQHKKLALICFCLWEYVSITGVIIVLMLRYLTTL